MAAQVTLIEDTRQQAGKHDTKHDWFDAHGVVVVRSKLAFGDYALPPAVAVDTKRDLYELAYDIDHDHERFRREVAGARDAGCRLVVLVENDDGVSSLDDLRQWCETDGHLRMRCGKSRNPRTQRIEGKRLAKACRTMAERYGVRFEFCPTGLSGRRITELLLEGVPPWMTT